MQDADYLITSRKQPLPKILQYHQKQKQDETQKKKIFFDNLNRTKIHKQNKRENPVENKHLKMQSERASDHLGSKSHTKMKRKRMNRNVNESLNE